MCLCVRAFGKERRVWKTEGFTFTPHYCDISKPIKCVSDSWLMYVLCLNSPGTNGPIHFSADEMTGPTQGVTLLSNNKRRQGSLRVPIGSLFTPGEEGRSSPARASFSSLTFTMCLTHTEKNTFTMCPSHTEKNTF